MRHPIHPALVHFPIACWVLALPCDIVAWMHWFPWGRAAYLLILGGVLLALPAMLAGMLDLRRVKNNEPAQAIAYRHIMLIACAWLSYLFSLMLRFEAPASSSGIGVLATATGFVLLLIGAWHGAELVYHHGVGVHRNGATENPKRLTTESTEDTESL
jgi:uncharacterized membrane protein